MEAVTGAKQYDVIIAGAGPAGCACALALKDAGLRVALLNKETFPRDKVCGDAIPGRAIKTLKSIDPVFAEAFHQFPAKYHTRKTRLGFKGKIMEFDWTGEAYTCARMDFDNFLFSLVKEHTDTELYTDFTVDKVVRGNNSIAVTNKSNGLTLTATMLVGADGAQSVTAKQLTDRTIDRNHHVGSVRGYYENVACADTETTEIYFDKRFLPSYLWIFPLPGNKANVGFGMLSAEIAKRKINIRQTFQEFLQSSPELIEKFKNARLSGEIEGFSLPLGSRKVTVSGDNFLLVGDAASLIDPISGDGIGNAMLSGRLAAIQVTECFEKQNFNKSATINYEEKLYNTIGDELKMRYKFQKMLSSMPFLLDFAFLAGRNQILKKIINKAL